jgi:small GTP-binding protein
MCIINTRYAGQEEYKCLRHQYMRNGDGFLLVYSVTDRSSFQEIIQLKDCIVRVKDDGEYIPMVIIANKCDLEDRQVSSEEGKLLADEMGVPYFESSALLKINVTECFHEVVRQLRKKKQHPSLSVTSKMKKRKCIIQ